MSKQLYDRHAIGERINALATEVITRYKDKNPLFVCLLKGGVPFASQLLFAITAQDSGFNPDMEYAYLSAYGEKRVAGEVQTGLLPPVEGRYVVLLDDTLDTGVTAEAARSYALSHGAQAVDLIVLAQKQKTRHYWPEATICGFEVPDVWLAGMGLNGPGEAGRWAESLTDVTE